MTGRTDEGDVSAKISATGGSPELCLRPTIACPSPIVHPSQLLAHTVDVIARASTTANSVISQFDPVTKAVNVAATPSSTCATSLSGNLRTGAGVAVAGVLVTLTSVGAGALGAVFLAYLYPLRLTPPRLIATDIVHAIPLAVFAGLGHLLIGNVNFTLLGNLLVGSIPAVVVGAMLSARLPHSFLRMTLAVVLLSIGAKLWWTVAA